MLPAVPPSIGADGDDAELLRVLLAADQGLHVHDEARGDQDRIDRLVGRRAVAAAAQKGDLDVVDVRGQHARPVMDLAVGEGARVLGEAVVGLRKARQQAVLQHGLRPADRLLRRLADEHQGPAPAVLEPDQGRRRPDPGGHVDVVAAGVGHEGRPAVPLGLDVRGVGQARLLLDRQGVELGAHHDHRPGPVAVDGDHAGPADVLGHLEAQRPHLAGEQRRGARLVHGELGVGVDVLVEGLQVRVVGVEPPVDRRLRGRDVERPGGRRGPQQGESGGRNQNLTHVETPPWKLALLP